MIIKNTRVPVILEEEGWGGDWKRQRGASEGHIV